ncbi:hypothetical protein O3P69_015826 [Scylla paramamosain]|uniref:Uncharacterized protein n=1 Tax=Scylla paramamosain TaxID=85552 RepID=A0AAW0T8N5_SCYPA
MREELEALDEVQSLLRVVCLAVVRVSDEGRRALREARRPPAGPDEARTGQPGHVGLRQIRSGQVKGFTQSHYFKPPPAWAISGQGSGVRFQGSGAGYDETRRGGARRGEASKDFSRSHNSFHRQQVPGVACVNGGAHQLLNASAGCSLNIPHAELSKRWITSTLGMHSSNPMMRQLKSAYRKLPVHNGVQGVQ